MKTKIKVAPTVPVCRASGMPVKLEHIDMYKADWQALFDKVLAHVGFNRDAPHLSTPEMNERSKRILTRIERILLKRYPNKDVWPEVKSRRAWMKLVDTYGPICIAKSLEGGSMTYVILDIPLN